MSLFLPVSPESKINETYFWQAKVFIEGNDNVKMYWGFSANYDWSKKLLVANRKDWGPVNAPPNKRVCIMKYLIFFLFILFLNGCITNSNHSLEKILMEDFEANMIDAIIDNSEIVISTKGIEKVTKLGIAESPRIIKIMEKTNDFNLFVRCFCALQRIHNKRFEWSGGLEAKVVNGSLVFYNPILEAIGEFKSFKNQILDNLKAKIKK